MFGSLRRVGSALFCLLLVGTLAAPPVAADPDPNTRPGCGGNYPKRELRGVWIASVSNINWPSRAGLPADAQQQEYRALLDRAQVLRMNSVFVQVRPAADAFYPSSFEPWSQYLTGTQGNDPGYDPLEFLVAETHRRNLEFHAWFNPYRVSTQPDPAKLAPHHPARLHPEWIVGYGQQLYYNPGVPAAREFVENVIADVVARYDLDGVHFDDYFYPYPLAGQEFPDQQTYLDHGAAQFPVKADWRRDNVNKLMSGLSRRIWAAKPWVAFGVSPFGVWRDKRTDPTGSDTTAGVHNYDDLYADTRAWIRNGWIDYIAPQVYWNIGFPAAAYDKLVSWWSAEVAGTRVSLYIGQAAHKIGRPDPPAWANPEEMPRHIALNRDDPRVAGDIYFSAASVFANPLGFADRLSNDLYRYPALVPARPSIRGVPPRPPAMLLAMPGSRHGITLHWLADARLGRPTAFAVYRVDGRQPVTECTIQDPANLLGTVRAVPGAAQSFIDTSAAPGQRYTYLVTALDRGHYESRPTAVRVTVPPKR